MVYNRQVFSQELQMRKEMMDACLQQNVIKPGSFPPIIHEAMQYAVYNGGKRLRPIMVLEGARLAGGDERQVLPTACAMEMIHCYSLVHDDLPAMDNDDLRRGKPTCHIVYGEANAILAGDALLTRAFELIAANAYLEGIIPLNALRVIAEVAEAVGSRGMIGGQVIDLESEGCSVNYETLRMLHSLKTGALFRASLRAGAILCGMGESKLAAIDRYAANFGLAFQITDDILDVLGNQDQIGKPVGSDARNQKTTYASLFGMDGALQLARESVSNCLDGLAEFGPEADFLRNLAYYVLERNS